MSMKLSVCNIAWSSAYDDEMYRFLRARRVDAVEIAPTRILAHNPYAQLDAASSWGRDLMRRYALAVSSIQSIWYGRDENMFTSSEERESLLRCTKDAILFAEAVRCRNVVFGCPRGRCIPAGMEKESAHQIALSFFEAIGNYAASHGVVISIEANPAIYGTNFLNTTDTVISFLNELNNEGCKLNLDSGAIIEQATSASADSETYLDMELDIVRRAIPWTHHVHFSEPGLTPLVHRPLYGKMIQLFEEYGYQGYFSVEIGADASLSDVKSCINDVASLRDFVS